jgi:RTA1 like protein
VKASWYTWIFVSRDAISLGLQAAGGGIAAANNNKYLSLGTDIMIVGIISQVVSLLVFGYFLVEYFVRVFCHQNNLGRKARAILDSRRFQWFMVAIVVAFVGIFTRCVYRVPELLDGWGSPLMRAEFPFILLEGVMILVATSALTVCHPAWCFPAMLNETKGQNNNIDTIPANKDGDENPERLHVGDVALQVRPIEDSRGYHLRY